MKISQVAPYIYLHRSVLVCPPWQVPVASLPFRQPTQLCLVGKISSHFERVTVFIASLVVIHSSQELGSMSLALSLLISLWHYMHHEMSQHGSLCSFQDIGLLIQINLLPLRSTSVKLVVPIIFFSVSIQSQI